MARPRLPAFVPPMLAKPGAAFDSDQYLFEVKWDGTRGLAFIEGGGYRLLNRRRIDMTARYPEFGFLAGLPPGTVLDGEVIVLHDGKPDFSRLQSREHTRAPLRVRTLARTMPATFVVFDQLYEAFHSIMDLPLEERRERLRKLVRACREPLLVLSEGVVGSGTAYFAEVHARGLEGMIAKRRGSRYLPGKRTDAWLKIKRGEQAYCAVIGFVPRGRDDFKSLILATADGGALRYAGKVGSGFDAASRRRVWELLRSRRRDKPLVPSKTRGTWVEPGIYCTVKYLERTQGGEFRAPVFESLHVE
jgi:DNA ligase D-like protein (predicted ligase)